MLIILLAFILDLLFGDPRWLPHPVRLIGYSIERLETILRNLCSEAAGGIILPVIIVLSSYLLTAVLIRMFSAVHYFMGQAVSVYFIYTSLSVKGLYQEGMRVYTSLCEGEMVQARKDLSMIVGRDTVDMEEKNIVRAAIEAIAENTVDGVLSPLFFAVLGGAPLAVAYKAVNTLDSMVGYQNDRYRVFGRISARFDDLANFIPARLSGIFIPLASWIMGKSGFDSLRTVLRDGNRNPSPNSGIPEAAFAGAMGIRLGGINYYQGRKSEKPFIGEKKKELSREDIREASFLMMLTSFLSMMTMIAVPFIFF